MGGQITASFTCDLSKILNETMPIGQLFSTSPKGFQYQNNLSYITEVLT